MTNRRAAKIDANQPEIVQVFEDEGLAVRSMAGVGDGFPDLLVWCGRSHHLVEVKGKRGTLTEKQKKFMRAWPGPVHIVRDPVQAKALIQEWQREANER